ncbi:MAG: polyprenyl synthetase family protein [Actinobacteria bacterium]|nr:polyprenyl synthetase family protein [Actinomycetota bacterium]
MERLGPEMAEVEIELAAATSHAEQLVDSATTHLARAGGKRLRPLLTLLASQLGSGVNDRVRRAAVAVEVTHLASLYHDDVMDSATLRRGAPAAQALWGNNVAILTGDLLFARASQLVASLGPEAVLIHAETFERLCLGQLHEALGPQAGEDPVAHYLGVLADKTGSLIATSARYGALFSGAPADAVAVMEAYGEKVGVAFQLADDVIDLSADSATSGKTPGTDLKEGVDTMPVLLLRRRGSAGELDEAGEAILGRLGTDLDDAALARVVADLRAHPVVEDARAMARAWADDAVAELDALPRGEVRDALEEFAVLLVDRLS